MSPAAFIHEIETRLRYTERNQFSVSPCAERRRASSRRTSKHYKKIKIKYLYLYFFGAIREIPVFYFCPPRPRLALFDLVRGRAKSISIRRSFPPFWQIEDVSLINCDAKCEGEQRRTSGASNHQGQMLIPVHSQCVCARAHVHVCMCVCV